MVMRRSLLHPPNTWAPRGSRSCWTPTVVSPLYSRASPAAGERPVETPKFALPLGPISLSSAMLSRLRSVQLRVSLTVVNGSYRFAQPPAHGSMYLLTLPLTAVFESPNRSYTALNRGDTLFQFGMSGILSRQNAPTNRPAARHPPWISALK